MGALAGPEIERKAAAVRSLLGEAIERHGRLVYANSLGAEAMVLTDIICSHLPRIDMFSIDTGRLHEETYQLLERLQRRYRRSIRLVYPDAAALEQLVAAQGVNGFYASVAARLECCRVRKLEPFRRALAGYPAWVTGVRREQTAGRARGQAEEWDAAHGVYKLSPLLDWSEAQVWEYIRLHALPYNALHDRQYPSIGCAPCTRAIQPGESRRSGRWWWEQPESRECGLHPRTFPPAGVPAALSA
ncbi:MAG TPA: phosphoadenylyl-sulfate reductase [Steroidobacteraceae bacterium]|jgi:phosphoadenosine phosphosulfate reductase|nr:phosphoadenylyl-sulfate reductase [Steroidobacteraceae bacterium]